MKLCINCKSEIEENTKYCPICGKEQESIQENDNKNNTSNSNLENQKVPGWLTVLIIIFFIGFFYMITMGHSESSNNNNEDTTSKYDTARVYNIGDTLDCPNFDVTIDITSKRCYINQRKM